MGESILIIGYGNPLRRDDGAGIVLAERLACVYRTSKHEVRLIRVQQLTPELAEEIAHSEVATVLFCDATIAAEDGPTPAVQLRKPILQDRQASAIGHHMTPEMLLLIAQRLYQHMPHAWIVTVPGRDFGYGLEISPSTQRAIDGVQNVLGTMFE